MAANGIRLIVSYDGTDFAGWQVQPGQRTVQGELEQAIEKIEGRATRVRAAARTDAGVHALGQSAAFDATRVLAPRNWVLALNSNLPRDVAVRLAIRCEPGYDPRFDAVDKTYLYLLHLGVVRDPFLRFRAWHLGRMVQREFPDRSSLEGATPKLDIEAMRQAAQVFVGTHDFRAFRASDDGRESTIRTIYEVSVKERHSQSPELLAVEVRGDSFLKAMVRIMVGTLVEVGRGRITLEQVKHLLESEATRQQAGETAPACGLTLLNVKLGNERRKTPSNEPR